MKDGFPSAHWVDNTICTQENRIEQGRKMLLNLKNHIKKNAAVICVFLSVVFLFIGCEITHPYYFFTGR